MAELKNLTERNVAERNTKIAAIVKKEGVTAAAANNATTTTPTAASATTTTMENTNSTSCAAVLSAHLHVHNNNNNNGLESPSAGYETKAEKNHTGADGVTKKWNCECCEAAENVNATAAAHYKCAAAAAGVALPGADVSCAGTVVDKGGGIGIGVTEGFQQEQLQQNGTLATPLLNRLNIHTLSKLAAAIAMPEATAVSTTPPDEREFALAACGDAGAASLTPPEGGVNSNRTSVNNSTEYLSYSSDNYYPDDLLLLEDDDDDDAEEISLNSDDCVYAYRGDGADFDLALSGRQGVNVDLGDDEPDFLEMDFEPDPLSEIEYGSGGGAIEMSIAPQHADAFLMQRDSCHLSGRHSANMNIQHRGTPLGTQRPLFSSPIDDLAQLLPPSSKALQSQALLNQNFACITLHLDKIKSCGCTGDGVHACRKDGGIGIEFERASALGMCGGGGVGVGKLSANATAHSLPNTLHSGFGRDVQEKAEKDTSPSKITGAKPKRIVTFSTSSSTSSKNSSKSRTSLRSAFALPPPALCASSSSFDERSVSCAEFRCAAGALSNATNVTCADECVVDGGADSAVGTSAGVSIANACLDHLSGNDEACLDCLEKEFVASTIGKALDPNECPKCRKRSGSLSLYKRAEREARCRSGSPTTFFAEESTACDEDSAASRFESSLGNNDIMSTTTTAARGKRWGWKKKHDGIIGVHDLKTSGSGGDGGTGDCTVLSLFERGEQAAALAGSDSALTYNLMGKLVPLSSILLAVEPEVVTIPTLNLNEEALVQALNKLHVGYNSQLIKTHFNLQNSYNNLPKCEFESLKHMLLFESKKPCNYPKLKRLIELATLKTVHVEFKEDTNRTEAEMVPVKVADILYQWTRTKDLDAVKQLDKRFSEANAVGKIANIIRQSEQRGTPRQPLPEFISIPQYFPSGYLTLTKTLLNTTKR